MATAGEVACPGGEEAFVRAIVRDSLVLKKRVNIMHFLSIYFVLTRSSEVTVTVSRSYRTVSVLRMTTAWGCWYWALFCMFSVVYHCKRLVSKSIMKGILHVLEEWATTTRLKL